MGINCLRVDLQTKENIKWENEKNYENQDKSNYTIEGYRIYLRKDGRKNESSFNNPSARIGPIEKNRGTNPRDSENDRGKKILHRYSNPALSRDWGNNEG
jgi:hypothetical protein